ncbi:hypothetical protein [Algoriphagus ratkowskyi]|uniref:Uncharacterized protein n=1 Tax=Algoriphagus ratkowskyi TaxID=57028 RepID=A0ABY3HTF9_9BACT|nr:hypothetical protein [Algoriphagus ratkowskyi]TXD79900.1 hypothetical protein ESW18_01850 [Algoriphagus ratkowskyi]
MLLIAVIFFTAIIQYFNTTYFIWATGITMISVQLFYTWKLIKRYPVWFADYMFDEKMVGLRKKVEKPRIFFYSIFWPIMGLCIYVVVTTPPKGDLWKDVFLFAPFVFLFIFGVLFLDLTWKSSFENRYIPLVKKTLKQGQKEFKTHYSSAQLAKIFDGLVDLGLIEYMDLEKQKFHREQFVEIFRKGIVPPAPQFDLNIQVIDAVYFFTQLNFKIDSLTNTRLAKIFLIKGEPIKSGSLRSSKHNAKKTRSKSETEHHLDAIFSEIH